MTKQEIETLNLMRSHDKSATDIAPPSAEGRGTGRVPPMWKAGHAA